MSWRATGLIVMLVTLATGCSRQAEVTPPPPSPEAGAASAAAWTTVAVADMTADQKAQQQRCAEAVQAMAGRLMGELTGAVDAGGPQSAIEVCRTRAPEITAAIANEYGVVIGRTSFRLRNPANAPPEWAAQLVRDHVAGPTWLVAPDGRLGGMLPIKLKAECLTCHGPKELIAPEVLAKIEAGYPSDAATGFREGDLRGWFWVVAPAGA